MCKAKTPKVEKSAPPPMYIPEANDPQAVRKRDRERLRAQTAFGRESTVLGGGGGFGGGAGPTAGAPTSQGKTLLGS